LPKKIALGKNPQGVKTTDQYCIGFEPRIEGDDGSTDTEVEHFFDSRQLSMIHGQQNLPNTRANAIQFMSVQQCERPATSSLSAVCLASRAGEGNDLFLPRTDDFHLRVRSASLWPTE